ncbi:hypothetical protein L596_014702 [Steinernema carpocapsae]|uniref:C2H2-type domain-containing protein n=1 Tax=Steinernema carpocapsae TaxID=34508 RepID=A0A4U5ND72_STECR|nr:hypothetical protein L596_014702 [Steinernema carpocapsae]
MFFLLVSAKEAFDTERKQRIDEEIRKTGDKNVAPAGIIAENPNAFPQRISMSIVSKMNYDISEPVAVRPEKRRVFFNPFKKRGTQNQTGLADEIDDEKQQISQIVQRISSESAVFEQKAQQQAMRYASYQQQMPMAAPQQTMSIPGTPVDSYGSNMKPFQQASASVPQPDPQEEKRFKCQYEGCTKRYKNSQGVRYHMRMAHQNQPSSGETSTGRATPISGAPSPGQNSTDPNSKAAAAAAKNAQKPYKCQFCNKRYKTTSGLQNHVQSSHQRVVAQPPVDPSTISLNDNSFQNTGGYVTTPNEMHASPSQSANIVTQQQPQYIVQGQQPQGAHMATGELNPGVTVRAALQNQMYSQARQLITANEGGGKTENYDTQIYSRTQHRQMPMQQVNTEGGSINHQQSRVPGLTVTPMPQRLISQQRMMQQHGGPNPNGSQSAQLIRVSSMDQGGHQQMHQMMDQSHSAYSSPSYTSQPVSTYGQIVQQQQPGMMVHHDQQ